MIRVAARRLPDRYVTCPKARILDTEKLMYAFIAVEPLIKMRHCGLNWSCLGTMTTESGEEIHDCQSCETLKYGREAHKTWNQEWLCRWGSTAVLILQLTQRARAENSLMTIVVLRQNNTFVGLKGPRTKSDFSSYVSNSLSHGSWNEGWLLARTSSSVPDLPK